MTMNDKVYIGIDCDDAEFKVTYLVDSKLFNLPRQRGLGSPLIYFDKYAKMTSLGVGFPSILQRLGTHIPFMVAELKVKGHSDKLERRIETSETVISNAFASIRKDLLSITNMPIGATVVAVPSATSQNWRKALLDCAITAGFEEVSLIDKCTAAALGHYKKRDKPLTVLVFNLDYRDGEFSLLRLTKERCRVIASEVVLGLSGEVFDGVIMESTVLALRREKIFLGLKNFTPIQWLEFRLIAENARNSLAKEQEVQITLIPQLTGLDVPIQIRYNSDSFANRISPLIGKAIDGLHGVLEANTLELTDIDAFLLTGNVAINPPVIELLRKAFDGKPARTDPYLVANGAAWQASRLAEQMVDLELPPFSEQSIGSIDVSSEIESDDAGAVPQSRADIEFAEVVLPNKPVSDQSTQAKNKVDEDASDTSLSTAKRLLEQGKLEEAAAILDKITSEVEAIRSRIEQGEVVAVSYALMQQAQTMFNNGHFIEAIGLSHQAYGYAPNNLEIFEGMMKIHASAGLALDKPGEYEAAINILNCAHGHDRTDQNIHRALADRHYIQAIAMRDMDDMSQACEIANKALSFDPKHVNANKLIKELMAKAIPSPLQE